MPTEDLFYTSDQGLKQQLTPLIQAQLPKKRNHPIEVSAGIVEIRQGEQHWIYHRNFTTRRPIHLASCSKQFTAAAILSRNFMSLRSSEFSRSSIAASPRR